MQANKQKELMEVQHNLTNDSRTFTQYFLINNYKINHENCLEVGLKGKEDSGLQVRNHFARTDGNAVSKVTQIQLNGRVIKIVDKFTSSEYTPHISSTNQMANTQITNESSRKNLLVSKPKVIKSNNGKQIVRMRDTKNVVKNIFRLFQSWVEERASKESGLSALLCSLLKNNGKYNNSLIIMMLKNKKIKQAFQTFSETDGEDYIQTSKIHDKESHIEALKRYRRICINQQIKEEENQEYIEKDQQELNKQKMVKRQYGSTDSGSGGNGGGIQDSPGERRKEEIQA